MSAGESSNVEEKENNEKGNTEAKSPEMRSLKKTGTLGQGSSGELEEILGLD